jgi:hypothetical protein
MHNYILNIYLYNYILNIYLYIYIVVEEAAVELDGFIRVFRGPFTPGVIRACIIISVYMCLYGNICLHVYMCIMYMC